MATKEAKIWNSKNEDESTQLETGWKQIRQYDWTPDKGDLDNN